MDIKVMKFGGTSLRNESTRKYVYEHIISNLPMYKIVLVVSAMGRYPDVYATDTLLSLGSNRLSEEEKARLVSIGEQLSSLKICSELLDMGIKARAISFHDAGIISDSCYEYAKIEKLDGKNIKDALKKYDVVVVGGFVAVTSQGKVTTLGRGGSDYSATLFAKMLHVKDVEIYTDVDGIYTKDPKLNLPKQKYQKLTYDETLHLNCKVLHDRCVKYAKEHGIRIHLRGTFSKNEGTIIEN